jgi:hypothetical protein
LEREKDLSRFRLLCQRIGDRQHRFTMRLTPTTATINPREKASKSYKPRRHEGLHEDEIVIMGVDTIFVNPFVIFVSSWFKLASLTAVRPRPAGWTSDPWCIRWPSYECLLRTKEMGL